MRSINIRRFTREGSTSVSTVLQEAEAILQGHLSKGGLAVDEDRQELISSIMPDTEKVLLLDPIVGG